MISQLRFVSIGKGRALCANRIWGITALKSKQSQRWLADAKTNGTYIDWSGARSTKSLIFLDNGYTVGSFFAAKTIYNRLVDATESALSRYKDNDAQVEDEEDDEEDETV